MSDFGASIGAAYGTDAPAIDAGRGVHDGAVAPEAVVKLPLSMMNRHGLVAGATGTGKTKTLQGIAEQLSAAGVPVFIADVKGDVSGLAAPGEAGGPAEKRMQDLGLPFQPTSFPVEFLSLGGIGPGVPVRATVSDFGPQLLAKVLEANETQEQSLGLVFHYADAKGLPLLDLSDLRALLTFLSSDEGKAELEGIGGLSSATVGVLLRALVGLEDGGGNEFFGDPQLEIADLIRTAPDGRGVISCVELPAVQDKPALFSTALMWLVAELFEELPEVGDLDKPKLVFFFDEAHLLFDGATDAFLDSVAQTVRLIRSKGVGVFFVTQTPSDVPAEVLGQLGNRVQHALRAFTPQDAKALKATVSTFPKSEFYDLEELLTQMGIGEAAVTILSESGVPTPVVHTRMVAPASRMAPADDIDAARQGVAAVCQVRDPRDAESAREKLAARVEQAAAPSAKEAPPEGRAQGGGQGGRRRCGDGRQVPEVARGEGDAEAGDARGVRHAQEEVLMASPGPTLHRGARGAARVAAVVRREGDPPARARVGGGARVPALAVQAHGRARLPRHLLSGGVRRPGRRHRARRRVRRGDGALRLRRSGGGDRRPHRDRDAADPQVRHRGAEAALARAGAHGREDRGAGDHRAGRRLGRRGHEDVRARATTASTS